MLLEKLKELYDRYYEIQEMMGDPEVIADRKRFVKLNKDYKDLEPIVKAYNDYSNILNNIKTSEEMLNNEDDPEMKNMAKEELEDLRRKKEEMEEKIKYLLIPKDPEDEKNAVVEIRAGTGGDEASIFAGDLFRMYSKFIEKQGWKIEPISNTEGTVGGFKEIIFNVSGENVYGTMKFESGVHRVQRVPQTETQGRVHTSAASVAVLPEAEEFEVEINENDIRRDTFCASGPGGQSVNTTYSAIRLTHHPTGIVVSCQDEKSQLKNYNKAMRVLRSRIYEREYQKYLAEIASKRKTMVSTGDRSAKIRTYNFPQSRVTDHRINLTVYNLQSVMNGDLEEIIEAIKAAENAEKLKETVNEEET
ncbi:MAG: peptide chain release factor 1 [Bacteroidales bacterium]|nr:peptide chain release factor 1 [Bacteroidales bacterium]MCF8337802.1 peptide chain release factor 1 [Bacteroidales bacterium]